MSRETIRKRAGGVPTEPPLHFAHAEMKFPVAREGWLFIVPAAVFTVAALLIHWFFAAIVLGFITALLVHFFRDPIRTSSAPEEEVLAPAEGTVVHVKESSESAPEGLPKQISIMMSMFDVQVNRAPIGGIVVAVERITPSRLSYEEGSEAKSEQISTVIEAPGGRRVGVRQFAGVLARPLVDKRRGDTVARGERIGMIKFGSRVDLLLPERAEITVRAGEHVKVGLTTVARLKGVA